MGAGCVSNPLGNSEFNQNGCEYEATAEQLDPAEDIPAELTRFQRTLVNRTVRQGQATAYYGPRPLKNISYISYDGAYYRIQHTKNSTAQLPALVATIEWNSNKTASEHGDVLSFSSLPKEDRLALRSAVYGGIYREQIQPETVFEYSKSPILYPNGTGGSDLASRDHIWVSWAGQVYEITVHGKSTMGKTVHRYHSTRVATDAGSFRRLVADRYIVHLDNLTSGEREILDAATTGGYHEQTKSPSQTWNRLSDRLRKADFPKRGVYIEYEGELYRLRLSSVCTYPATSGD